jgi:hypothetical protein
MAFAQILVNWIESDGHSSGLTHMCLSRWVAHHRVKVLLAVPLRVVCDMTLVLADVEVARYKSLSVAHDSLGSSRQSRSTANTYNVTPRLIGRQRSACCLTHPERNHLRSFGRGMAVFRGSNARGRKITFLPTFGDVSSHHGLWSCRGRTRRHRTKDLRVCFGSRDHLSGSRSREGHLAP